MVCRTTFTKLPRRNQAGMTLMELMVASALASVVAVAVASLMFYTGRSFAAMVNYVELDNQSRNALDTISREVRQARQVIAFTASSLTLEDSDGVTLAYVYEPAEQRLMRYKAGEDDKELLKECVFLQFSPYQRNPKTGVYDQYPSATPETCKLVQMRWVCRRTTLGTIINTESVQSAKVVIRKQ